jgi:hypothetical protein
MGVLHERKIEFKDGKSPSKLQKTTAGTVSRSGGLNSAFQLLLKSPCGSPIPTG